MNQFFKEFVYCPKPLEVVGKKQDHRETLSICADIDGNPWRCCDDIQLFFPYEFLGLSLHDSFKKLIHGATIAEKRPDPSIIYNLFLRKVQIADNGASLKTVSYPSLATGEWERLCCC